MPIAADEFRAMATRCRKRANETAEAGLRDAYRQLALGYMRLAVQREAIEHCHALIGRFDAASIEVRLPPGCSGNDWSHHEHRCISLPPRRPGFIGAQLRRYDGSALRDGATLGRKSKRTSPGVSALGAADARNDGPDRISEAARRRGAATPQIRQVVGLCERLLFANCLCGSRSGMSIAPLSVFAVHFEIAAGRTLANMDARL